MGGTIPALGNSDTNSVLQQAWAHYRAEMIADDGRPLAEPDRHDLDSDHNTSEQVTYSETVAYTLLRATLMGTAEDQEIFSRVWNWAQSNMQRINIQTWTYGLRQVENQPVVEWYETRSGEPSSLPSALHDHLFAWRYVPTLNGGQDGPGGIIRYEQLTGADANGYNAASDDIEIAAALYFAYRRGWGDGD
ncbi:MAG: glycosyl hydrolase family 8, partial [Candidatus Omnitrophica bacterium]|nr:glycosyl hydrolase family 8 [Candidatus Omnitrophota bacterium]